MGKLIKDKTFNFAVRIVKLNRYLQGERKEYVMSKQILRSGTSIGYPFDEPHISQ
jgi:four helix bundle protein